MIPNIDLLLDEITEYTIPNKTYRVIIYDDKDYHKFDRINGFITDYDSVRQSIYFILNTERYKYIIYSWNYGIELYDLIGKPMPYVKAEIPRRITEALLQDDRIENVTDFKFKENGNKLSVTFTVVSNVGNISTELEVDV